MLCGKSGSCVDQRFRDLGDNVFRSICELQILVLGVSLLVVLTVDVFASIFNSSHTCWVVDGTGLGQGNWPGGWAVGVHGLNPRVPYSLEKPSKSEESRTRNCDRKEREPDQNYMDYGRLRVCYDEIGNCGFALIVWNCSFAKTDNCCVKL